MARKINLDLTENDLRGLRSVLDNLERQGLIMSALKNISACMLEALTEGIADIAAGQAEPQP